MMLHTYLPQMYDPHWLPQACSIHVATARFSVPWSPRSWDGTPYAFAASRKRSRTVEALLLLLAHSPVISHEYPSINPWITIPHRISPGYPHSYQPPSWSVPSLIEMHHAGHHDATVSWVLEPGIAFIGCGSIQRHVALGQSAAAIVWCVHG